MAVRAVVATTKADVTSDIWTWSGLTQASADTGTPVSVLGAKSLLAIIVSGTLGAAGSILWQGSIDNGTTWFSMNSDIGAPAAAAQVALLTPTMLKERPMLVRPFCNAGDGTTTLVAALAVGR